ncbi:MAG: protein kinase [Elusimicrobiota bacterium]|jgi:tRNA A-37 threonylcarbamoyl transferase component Bud32
MKTPLLAVFLTLPCLLSSPLSAAELPGDASSTEPGGTPLQEAKSSVKVGGGLNVKQGGVPDNKVTPTSDGKELLDENGVVVKEEGTVAGAVTAGGASQAGGSENILQGLLGFYKHRRDLDTRGDGHHDSSVLGTLYTQAFGTIPTEMKHELLRLPRNERMQIILDWQKNGGDTAYLESLLRGRSSGQQTASGVVGQSISQAYNNAKAQVVATPTKAAATPVFPSAEFIAAGDYASIRPTDVAGQRYLAVSAYKDGEYKTARDAAAIAMKDGPAKADLLTAYAGSSFHLGDYGEARRAAAEALRIDPQSQEATAVLKLAETRAPQAKPLPGKEGIFGAERELEGAQDGAAARGDSPGGGALPAAQGERVLPGRSAEEISRVENERLLPDSHQRSVELAREAATKMQVKDFAGAKEAATKALAAEPANAQALVYRSMANNRLGDYSAARADATEALRVAPMAAPSLLARAFAENRLKDYPPALEDSNAALAREPRNSFGYLMRAYAQAGLGRETEMRASLESAAAFNPAFRPIFERALQVPEGSDAMFLFEGETLPGLSATDSAARRRLPWWPFAAGLGLAAAAWGFLRRRIAGATTVRRIAESAPAAPASSGSIPTGYAVLRSLGAGGMGEVYEAKDLALDRRVAVKRMREELRRDPRERARFLEEARLVAKLRHPGIVEVYHILEDASDVYLVFEYVEGRTLGQVLAERRRLPFREAKALLCEVCAAVEHAHAHGVVHRDLKPANIMLNAEGRAKVMDFGIARHAQEALTRMAHTGTVAGTPPYMAPEQELGQVGRESDVFALGVLLYETLTGEQPFAGSPAGMLMAKREGRFQRASERAPELPSGVDELLVRALAPEPEARLRSAAALSAELQKLG